MNTRLKIHALVIGGTILLMGALQASGSSLIPSDSQSQLSGLEMLPQEVKELIMQFVIEDKPENHLTNLNNLRSASKRLYTAVDEYREHDGRFIAHDKNRDQELCGRYPNRKDAIISQEEIVENLFDDLSTISSLSSLDSLSSLVDTLDTSDTELE